MNRHIESLGDIVDTYGTTFELTFKNLAIRDNAFLEKIFIIFDSEIIHRDSLEILVDFFELFSFHELFTQICFARLFLSWN